MARLQCILDIAVTLSCSMQSMVSGMHSRPLHADLDLGQLAMAMGLLRVPRMPEIKHASVALRNFTPSDVDPDTVKVPRSHCFPAVLHLHADLQLKLASADIVGRQHRHELRRVIRVSAVGQRFLCCDPQFADKAREKQRQKALTAKAKAAAAQDAARQQDSGSRNQQQKAAAEAERKHLPAAKRRLIESRADADDMSGDYALLRKVKKGKITEVRFRGMQSCSCSNFMHHTAKDMTYHALMYVQ